MEQKFLKPKFSLNSENSTTHYTEFVVNQLERGYGTTLANALRRTLLSSVPGISVYAIKIAGVSHEFTAVKGVIENVSEIILNVKDLVLAFDGDIQKEEKITSLKINVTGEQEVTAGDIICPTEVRVVNPDLVIATTTSRNVVFDMELFVKKSRGYSSFENNKKEIANSSGIIAIDADYSPVSKVEYKVEPVTKTIKDVEYEKLTIGVQTNGSIKAASAIAMAAKILMSHIEFFINLDDNVKNFEVISIVNEKENDSLNLALEELNLTVRSYNCLKRDGFKTLGDIASKSLEEIKQIKHLGSKSVKEIEDCIARNNLEFSNKN